MSAAAPQEAVRTCRRLSGRPAAPKASVSMDRKRILIVSDGFPGHYKKTNAIAQIVRKRWPAELSPRWQSMQRKGSAAIA